MKLIEAVNAYMAAQALSREKMPYATALAVVKVKRATSDLKDFFVEEERKLVEEYAARDEDGRIRVNENGRFALRAGACAADYEKARKELAETETGAEGEKIRVRAPETITPEQLEALAPWIEWEAEE